MPKIAVAGKGGVGKTSFSAVLAYLLAEHGHRVYAIDADPNPTLGMALGFPADLLRQITPIGDMDDLIEERTGARPGSSAPYFRMNPRVDDIPARFSVTHRGVHLLHMGSVKGAGAGCVCPENTLIRALVTHLLLRERETVIMDMVAGLEHLGRGTASAVDMMFVIIEPGMRSLDVAHDIAELARDLGIPEVSAVANKIRGERDIEFIQKRLQGIHLQGWLPMEDRVIEADMMGQAIYDASPEISARVKEIAERSGLLDDRTRPDTHNTGSSHQARLT